MREKMTEKMKNQKHKKLKEKAELKESNENSKSIRRMKQIIGDCVPGTAV